MRYPSGGEARFRVLQRLFAVQQQRQQQVIVRQAICRPPGNKASLRDMRYFFLKMARQPVTGCMIGRQTLLTAPACSVT